VWVGVWVGMRESVSAGSCWLWDCGQDYEQDCEGESHHWVDQIDR
jgi:hypothetical protein